MTKSELVIIIAKEAGISINRADFAFHALIDWIIEELKHEDQVKLIKLGTFTKSNRSERLGLNPKTGETLTVKACKVVRFTPCKKFKQILNQ